MLDCQRKMTVYIELTGQPAGQSVGQSVCRPQGRLDEKDIDEGFLARKSFFKKKKLSSRLRFNLIERASEWSDEEGK